MLNTIKINGYISTLAMYALIKDAIGFESEITINDKRTITTRWSTKTAYCGIKLADGSYQVTAVKDVAKVLQFALGATNLPSSYEFCVNFVKAVDDAIF